MTVINPWADFMIGLAAAYVIIRLGYMIKTHHPRLKIKIKRNKIDK